MALPLFQGVDRVLSQLQTQWSTLLNPLLSNPINKGNFLTGIALANGDTTFSHLLDRQQQGWIITDVNGAAHIYRSQAFNSKTLTLTSDAAVVVNLLVY